MNEDFSPSKLFTRMLHYWWVLAALIIAGGLIGMLLSRINHPLYESSAAITSVIDYSNLGKLDDWEEDQEFRGIGDVIGSTEVKNEVLSRAKADQIALTEDQLTKSFSLDRQDNRWVLRVRLNDPQLAQKLDRYWSESAMQALQTMKAKAVTGFIGQEYLNSLATCLQQSVVLESNSTSCNVQNIPLIQSEIKKAVDDPEMNLASSSLTLFHTSFQLTTEATLPGAPVLFSQNTSALAGMLIGLIIGLVLLSIDFPIWAKDKGEH